MTDDEKEKAIISRWLTQQIDSHESEAKRIEYGNDCIELNDQFGVAKDHIRSANTLRGLLGKLQ